MTAAVLALAASALWGASDFVGGLKARGLSVLAVLTVSQPAGLVVIGAVVAVRGETFPPGGAAGYAVLAGAGGLAGIAALYRGLAVGAMGVVAPISATAPIVPVAVGIARGERPTAVQAAGMVLALAGVALASFELAPERSRRLALGAGLGLAAALCFGGTFLALNEASDEDPYWATLLLRATSCVIVAALVLRVRRRRVLRPHVPALAFVGVVDVTATCLFAVASTRGLISLVSVLVSLYPVVVVILARIVLGERLHPLQRAGAASALAGAALISAG